MMIDLKDSSLHDKLVTVNHVVGLHIEKGS